MKLYTKQRLRENAKTLLECENALHVKLDTKMLKLCPLFNYSTPFNLGFKQVSPLLYSIES